MLSLTSRRARLPGSIHFRTLARSYLQDGVIGDEEQFRVLLRRRRHERQQLPDRFRLRARPVRSRRRVRRAARRRGRGDLGTVGVARKEIKLAVGLHLQARPGPVRGALPVGPLEQGKRMKGRGERAGGRDLEDLDDIKAPQLSVCCANGVALRGARERSAGPLPSGVAFS